MPTRPISLEKLTFAAEAWRERLLQLLFPPACVSCQAPMDTGGPASFCGECQQQLAIFEPPFCTGCGRSVPQPLKDRQVCGHCRHGRRRFERAVALAPYDGLLRDLLLRAKKPYGESTAAALGRQLVSARRPELEQLAADVICPVPMHWRRRAWRLASSASTLAEVIAGELDLPLAAGLLKRCRHTAPQFSLPPSGRLGNVRRAFALRAGYCLSSAHVLLVDDILTTGATCNEAARTLLKAGAGRVSVAVIARSFSSH